MNKQKVRILKEAIIKAVYPLLKEEIEGQLTNEIVDDLFNAISNSEEIKNLGLSNDIFVEGEKFDYGISYNVNSRPGYKKVRGGDWYTEDEYELEGELSFDIKEIEAYTKNGDEYCDVLSMLNAEQYENLKKIFEFNMGEVAYDEHEWKEMNKSDF
jgi:hypothetical protein